uniref:Uncharacterized protein n=1 Tax=Solanum tuberosum TaxID=4113 RepID=M1DNV4_SOLTU
MEFVTRFSASKSRIDRFPISNSAASVEGYLGVTRDPRSDVRVLGVASGGDCPLDGTLDGPWWLVPFV